MAKDFVRLCNFLQEPRHVARFQNICGVKGTFPPGGVNKGTFPPVTKEPPPLLPREAGDDAQQLSNGDCGGGGGAREEEETVKREYPLQRTGQTVVIANGTTTSTGGTAAVSGSFETGDATVTTDRAKPLRRNSLTGDVGQEFIIHNKFLFYLFTFGTELGNEMFFIVFFPFLFWNVDALVGRRLIVVWAWNLFFGQSTKDLVRWSRPASPPVVKVEVFYNSEYSMPSTHAMTGTAIPFCVFFLSYGRWQYPFLFGLCVALSWSFLVCVSRVYMGMHSILEVITGFLYTLLILAVLLPCLDQIDTFYMTGRYAPLAVMATHVGMGLMAFSLDSWSTSRGDTAQGLATAAGVALATHANHRLGLSLDPPASALPLALPLPGAALLQRSLLRFGLGVACLLATRMIMKALTIPLLCRAFGLPPGDVRGARQHRRVELPYRYIVYSVVGFSCVCPVPLLLGLLGLS